MCVCVWVCGGGGVGVGVGVCSATRFVMVYCIGLKHSMGIGDAGPKLKSILLIFRSSRGNLLLKCPIYDH